MYLLRRFKIKGLFIDYGDGLATLGFSEVNLFVVLLDILGNILIGIEIY